MRDFVDFEQYVFCLKELVAFKSTNGEKKTNMPFGEENYKALNYFLKLAESFGFKTINYDNYAGEVVFGESEKEEDDIGIIGHLDIVPPSTGWDTDPYTLTRKDGKIIGRGVEDDKGPLLLCLFVLKALKENGGNLGRKIRLFAGCNEETGWEDVEYLKSKTKLPTYGFSPDGNFPVIYAEKGMYYLAFHLDEFKSFTDLSGGSAINAVCSYAKIKSKVKEDEAMLKKYGLHIEDGYIISEGVTAHGSEPKLGVNAFRNLFAYLSDCGEDLSEFVSCAFDDKYKIFDITTKQGGVTLSPNLIRKTSSGYDLYCDLRVPAPLEIDRIIPLLDKFGKPYTLTEKHPPVMIDADGFFVKALNEAYETVMNKVSEPQSMGGSTFARAFSKGCAFGICEEGESGGAHKANEYINENFIEKAFLIYYNALINLKK